ncbi:MAG: nuclear transport factor 2 family protein [Paracoccaceae bacterium]|nr:nuclear transport factor 2 family protein [Paracoccaceae bacterium]
MSDNSNVQTLKRCYDEWHETRGGSVDAWLDIVADDFNLRSMAEGRPGAEFTAPRETKEQLAEYLSGLTGGWNMEYYRVDRYIEDGDMVVALGSTAWTNKATGKRVDTLKADFWTFKDGKATSFLEFYDSCALLEASA